MRHKKTKRVKNKTNNKTKNKTKTKNKNKTNTKNKTYIFKKYGGNKLKMKSKKHNHSNKHKKTTTSHFVKLNCSPENENKNSSLNEYTCYSNEDLHKLRDIWNARHPDKPIQTNDSKVIWETIKNHYQTTCNKESCWIKQMAKGTQLE